jgi:hypothetical protein
MLMEKQLNKAIQVEMVDGKVMGHDSAEDARAAGELVRLKVQTKWAQFKGDGWKLENGVFEPPPGKVYREGKLTEAFLENESDGERLSEP